MPQIPTASQKQRLFWISTVILLGCVPFALYTWVVFNLGRSNGERSRKTHS